MRTHTGEKSHRWDACGSASSTSSDLTKHADTYGGEIATLRCIRQGLFNVQ